MQIMHLCIKIKLQIFLNEIPFSFLVNVDWNSWKIEHFQELSKNFFFKFLTNYCANLMTNIIIYTGTMWNVLIVYLDYDKFYLKWTLILHVTYFSKC